MRASFVSFCNWTARWKTGMKVAKPKDEIKKRKWKEKAAHANMKPSMGSPAWETLNGVRPPLNPLKNSQQTSNQACLRLLLTNISPKAKGGKPPPRPEGQRKEEKNKKKRGTTSQKTKKHRKKPAVRPNQNAGAQARMVCKNRRTKSQRNEKKVHR